MLSGGCILVVSSFLLPVYFNSSCCKGLFVQLGFFFASLCESCDGGWIGGLTGEYLSKLA